MASDTPRGSCPWRAGAASHTGPGAAPLCPPPAVPPPWSCCCGGGPTPGRRWANHGARGPSHSHGPLGADEGPLCCCCGCAPASSCGADADVSGAAASGMVPARPGVCCQRGRQPARRRVHCQQREGQACCGRWACLGAPLCGAGARPGGGGVNNRAASRCLAGTGGTLAPSWPRRAALGES